MRMLLSKDLTTTEKVYLGAASIVARKQFGEMSQLANRSKLSRPTLYRLRHELEPVLAGCFDGSAESEETLTVRVDQAQLNRAVVALRATAPNSIPAIEELLPVLYPGVRMSYGKIWSIAAEAQGKAADFNQTVKLNPIKRGALDELFSQGHPVLGGVDLDSGYLFALAMKESRSEADWNQVLEKVQDQKLDLELVVKDAAVGIAAAVRATFPKAEQRDDCFHARFKMEKVFNRLERRAYREIAAEEDAERKRKAAKSRPGINRRKLGQKARRARQRCCRAIELFDAFEAAANEARAALELCDTSTGSLQSPEQMQTRLLAAAKTMQGLKGCEKLGRYLENRAPGLMLWARKLQESLELLVDWWGKEPVRLACLAVQIARSLRRQKHSHARRYHEQPLLLRSFDRLAALEPQRWKKLLDAIDNLFENRHRASSAIEGFNARLRPHLYVHKSVSQGFLDLFRASYNLRKTRWGRNKGTSPYERLTGRKVDDWLSLLGYPPSAHLS